jgi:tetratricopeptide (TPR) repeat protein
MLRAEVRSLRSEVRSLRSDVQDPKFEVKKSGFDSEILAGRRKLCQNRGKNWGCPVARFPRFFAVSAPIFTVSLLTLTCSAQVSHSEQVQIKPPLVRMIDPPPPEATVADLDARGDQLRGEKLYLDALDYYRAALAKQPRSAGLLNKIGITELMMQRYREAKKSFEHAIKADRNFSSAYNNLGVVYYEGKKYGAAVKQYKKAIALDENSASYYSNLGAAYFSNKNFDQAVVAYQKAVEIDPNVFENSSRAGVQAQLPSPEDRAHYDYTVAKLYAKMGFSDRSLEYLKKALEEGYKDFKNVYKDAEFAELRKDKRFTELMASKPAPLPE